MRPLSSTKSKRWASSEAQRVFAFGGFEALGLEFDAVEFDADDEGWRDAFADRLRDLDDQTGSVCKLAAVLVRPVVGGGGEELGE